MSCMNTVVTEDVIRVEVTIRASKDKVWEALTTREGWSAWFGEDITGDFHPGVEQTFDFGKYGTALGLVVERVEGESIAYKWHPGMKVAGETYLDDQKTTCRFTLQEVEGGTRLVMEESGFLNVPESRRKSAFADNSGGWESELSELVAWLEEGTRQPSMR